MAETTYAYAIRARNAGGLSPQSDPVSVTTPAAPLAKPTGLLTAASHDNVLLSWDNPDDDSITGYQVLRGDDADSLTVLLDDTESAGTSYTDSRVAAQTKYVYAVRARNAQGLGPQSEPVSVTTPAAPPEEDEPPTSARALAGPEFTLDGKDLDTDGPCNEDTIGDVTAACTIDIDTTTAIFAVDGTLDSDDRLGVRIGRDKAAVDAASNTVDQDDLVGADAEETLTFKVGRNLMRLWGDEDGTSGGSEEHFYRVNVVPFWKLTGDRLSKSDACRSATDRTAAQITDDDCIVPQFGNAPTIRFHNVITEQFNVYVHVNGTQVIREPGDTALSGPFTLDLQDGNNVVKVRLANKTGSHFSESYSSDRFHYKVKTTDVLVSNLGQVEDGFTPINTLQPGEASQFTTGSETDGYLITQVRLDIYADSGTIPRVSIYSDSSGRPGSSLKVLTNPGAIPTTVRTELDFGADNYKLDPSTPYWIVVERASGSGNVGVSYTHQIEEDTGSAAGWSIGDNSAYLSGATWVTTTGGIPQIAVKGKVAVSDDATLSALALRDASDNAIALTPAFPRGIFYTASVANSVSQIKVQPTASNSNATIEYLDSSDTTLADADPSTADVFDFDLDVGSNVVKVKVTAQDATTTKTYVVQIRRADANLLVSNIGLAENGREIVNATLPGLAVQFTTGSETDGYLISQVRLDIYAASGTIPKVSIYSDNSGQPGSSLKILTNPATIPTTSTELDFWAGNYKLAPSTPYWIVIEWASGSGNISSSYTDYTGEDTGTAVGWSIGDNGSILRGGTWSTVTGIVVIPRISVKGTVAPAVSDDATLSDLALTDASGNAVALDPAFASATTTYTASVANSVSQIKVQPTANDSNATIEYLDDSDATLPDADTGTADVFDFVLSEGSNVVKVKVTAEDRSTTETYTITVNRVDFLVSNLGQASGASTSITAPNTGAAVQFTTGSETDGYLITQVRLDIAANSGTIPRVSIYSDNSGQPGSSLKILTNPATIPTTRTEADFDADNYKLDPSTPYWIVIERASSRGGVFVSYVGSTAEDPGSAVDWSIGDNGSWLSGGTWSTVTGTIAIPQIAVRGRAATAASTDATLSALALRDASNNAVALSPAFASATTSYNATVANSVSRIKVEPTANDSNATIEYLDDSDATLPDADTGTADVFDFVLSEGSNVVKVKVTAEDRSTTETYTITVNRQAAAATASTDATLSALALFDFNSDEVTLSPAFAAAVTSYTAALANAHTDGKLEATPNDSNATVEFLDENDATITTGGQTGNVHSILPDFEVGENVFKVKVTAGDGTTSRTYTITVTRVDFLVSNLGQTEGGTWKLNTAGAGTAVQFMTGGNTLGYNISKVRLKLGSPSGIEPRVAIYSDNWVGRAAASRL